MKNWKSEVKEWFLALIIGIAFIALIRTTLFTTYHIHGDSMLPTLHSEDQVVVSLLSPIQAGDVVIVERDNEKDIVKRVIGSPGDTLQFRENGLYRNGEKVEEKYLQDSEWDPEQTTITLEDDAYFVMGDNRNRSLDSRELGTFSSKEIVGEVKLIYFPFTHLSWIHY